MKPNQEIIYLGNGIVDEYNSLRKEMDYAA